MYSKCVVSENRREKIAKLNYSDIAELMEASHSKEVLKYENHTSDKIERESTQRVESGEIWTESYEILQGRTVDLYQVFPTNAVARGVCPCKDNLSPLVVYSNV
ncbi:hypothetical protein TNCV_4918911 [Trichonephila clavipes]|nr:hypothetical protein TNCV_4918911 [Trichonephila clavipes]